MEDVKRSGMMVADVLNLRSINAIPVVDQFAKDMLRNALAVMLLIVNIVNCKHCYRAGDGACPVCGSKRKHYSMDGRAYY